MRFHLFECEFVLQVCGRWWRFPANSWVRIDKGRYSFALSFFWIEFFLFW